MLRRASVRWWSVLSVLAVLLVAERARANFVNFESGQVRPLALSPDGTRLFAVNTPDGRLEIFSLASGSPVHEASVPVGLEPVAVAARSNAEVWVVNHLSDSISIVDLSSSRRRASCARCRSATSRATSCSRDRAGRAFVTAAHRGQNRPGDAQLTTASVGRADVWVFDADALGAKLGGTPITILNLFGDTPRFAASPDGAIVHAAVFQSGNRTTTVSEGAVCNGGASASPCNVGGLQVPGGLPAPNVNHASVAQPEVGLIVKYDPDVQRWLDELGRNWNNAVKFSLPDLDVFDIDAMASPPVQIGAHAGVGTVLFDMAVNPVNGKLYVSNTEARNEVRFEGPGLAFGGSTVRSHLHEARITVIDGAACSPPPEQAHRLLRGAEPGRPSEEPRHAGRLAVSSNGAKLYVAGFGSSRVGVYDTRRSRTIRSCRADEVHPRHRRRSDRTRARRGARPPLRADALRQRDLRDRHTATAAEIDHQPIFNPEPAAVVGGRPMLYDARFTSSNGEASCSSCHVFGDNDSSPGTSATRTTTCCRTDNPFEFEGPRPDFHPLKGPMTTQSLRGMAHSGPMHWRGDRSGANDPGGTTPDALDEVKAFALQSARSSGSSAARRRCPTRTCRAFTDFILTVQYPPNPIRALDNVLTTAQQAGAISMDPSQLTDTVRSCNGCHTLDPAQGFLAPAAQSTFENETSSSRSRTCATRTPKVGMFGFPDVPFIGPSDHGVPGRADPRLRLSARRQRRHGVPLPARDRLRPDRHAAPQPRAVRARIRLGPRAPVVGRQVTQREGRRERRHAHRSAGRARRGRRVRPDREGQPRRRGARLGPAAERRVPLGSHRRAADDQGRAAPSGQRSRAEVTFTCVPAGSGQRTGVDRDGDGALDRDEDRRGHESADPQACRHCV